MTLSDSTQLDVGERSALNRRRAFRLETALPVFVETLASTVGTDAWPADLGGGARGIDALTEDISAGGLRLRAPEPLASGTLLRLQFYLDDTPVRVAGAVAHSSRDTFGVAVGVQFQGQDAAIESMLTRFITNRERRRLPRVSLMYPTTCTLGQSDDAEVINGVTDMCTPGFVTLLLHKPVETGRRARLMIKADKIELHLRGVAVASTRSEDLWAVGVELDESAPKSWRDIVIERRDGLR